MRKKSNLINTNAEKSKLEIDLKKQIWEEETEDPLVLKKQGISYLQKKDISYYKKKIIDEEYLEHAINRIAMELSHFILKDL
jgi:hypothetical protein